MTRSRNYRALLIYKNQYWLATTLHLSLAGQTVAFFGMVLGEGGVLMEASLFRTRPNHVHTYFIKYTATEYATPKPDGNLTRLSHRVRKRVWPARLTTSLFV